MLVRMQQDLRYGETGSLLKYFQAKTAKNSSFYYGVQLDAEEHITNIFWADPVMIIDYDNFGDVVSFDTTFRTNKEYRPFACFTGFNHFKETVLFGAALLYDETATSFQWLFETFLQAMSGKYPITIFTDQDQAMAKAISIVMPKTYHGLCTWHLCQNVLKHLGNIYKNDSQFSARFKECVYGYEEEHELFEAWESLLAEYNLHDNMWIKSTWALREKWGHVYMKRTFTGGMKNTQLSKSLNAALRKYLKSDHDIVQFFVHFERVVNDKRYKESESEYHARQKLPRLTLKRAPMLVQAGQVYTPTIFELFQDEYYIFQCAIATPCDVLDGWHQFVVQLYDKHREYLVLVKVNEEIVNCSCRKFEMDGILCGHALKVLDTMNIKQIPEQYICKRWRRDARKSCRTAPISMSNEEDLKIMAASRYRQLCPRMVQLAARCSGLQPAYQLVSRGVEELFKQVDDMYASIGDGGDDSIHEEKIENVDQNLLQVKVLKRKEGGYKGWGRLKSWHEKATKRKKGVSKPSHMSTVQSFSHPCTSAYGHSMSSQASNSVQSVMDTPSDSTHVHSLNDAESFFMNRKFNL